MFLTTAEDFPERHNAPESCARSLNVRGRPKVLHELHRSELRHTYEFTVDFYGRRGGCNFRAVKVFE